ncbi:MULTISPECIES: 5'-3' exonuclease [unclassified Staphylococcus]|uniref:5'-3' exonuclease n=1 Tax=unclassified Staphylococcus TaxID=91994 RepID=UPI0021D3C79E|nr:MULTISPECIES: 5'-3' exonuclease [unclassified Staphylococcus]UXR68760.1 5'-3' exonuclease [Staphylococcus sp. IVB6246]UXR70818.1 5'-3' exonuclease [Staphylococcus sp. IVB6240]UXR75343.1 5'-3' exonuclease [Staphylococcus sp. IVB6233]UXR79546.1 5'-3' exonuclease [Staphylococcus sp. IVB6218]
MNNRTLLIDGMALLFRHFYATSVHKNYMLTSNGLPTNGTQGFVRHVLRAIHDIQPTHLAICWDIGKSTFRNELYSGYKQNRPEPPEALIPQFSHVQHISQELGFFNIGLPNYEADDVIGTLATQMAHDHTDNVYVITGDRDLLQCTSNNIHIWLVKKGFTEYLKFDEQVFREQYGLAPKQLIDVKAFMGDTADGYPGVKGIGEKTAIKLIQQYGSVENVMTHVESLTPGQQKKIQTDMENLMKSKQLAEIICDVPIHTNDLWQQLAYTLDLAHIIHVCEQHELRVARKYILSL